MKKLLLVLCFMFISFEANSEVVKFSCNFTRGAMVENPPWNRGVTKTWEYAGEKWSFLYLDFENKWLGSFYPPLFKPHLKYEFYIEGDYIVSRVTEKDGWSLDREPTEEEKKTHDYLKNNFEHIIRLDRFSGFIKSQLTNYNLRILRFGQCDEVEKE